MDVQGAERLAEAASARGRRPVPVKAAALAVALVLLAVAAIASIMIGSRAISPATVLDVLLRHAQNEDTTVILDARLPRTVIALAAGVGLGVAGALIQAVTRNPLADPGVLGVTSGSAFAVAVGVGFLGLGRPSEYVWLAFAGALVATVLVYVVGSVGGGGADPVRLTLAGVALGAVLSGITNAIVLADPERFNAMRAWESGTLQGRTWDALPVVVPFIAVGVVIALALTPSLNAVALGDDLAASLGAHVLRTRVLAVIAVMLLAGGATALAGPIGFIGLMIPHVARWIVGPDQRWIMALTLVAAPILLLAADIVARLVLWPGEVPAGIVTAFLGAPVLIVLVRRQRASAL